MGRSWDGKKYMGSWDDSMEPVFRPTSVFLRRSINLFFLKVLKKISHGTRLIDPMGRSWDERVLFSGMEVSGSNSLCFGIFFSKKFTRGSLGGLNAIILIHIINWGLYGSIRLHLI